jgi:hypothetical protein
MGIFIFHAIKRMALLFLACLMVFPVILLFFVMEDTALVSRHQRLSLDNVQRVKTLINANTPANMNKRQIRTTTLSEDDLNLLLNYGILHGLGYERLFTKIELPDGRIHLFVSLDLPANPLGRYLNLFISLKKNGTLLDIERLKAGRIVVPAIFIHPALGAMNHVLSYSDLYADLNRHVHRIKDLSIEKGRLSLVYEWDPKALGLIHEKGKQFLLSRDHQEKLVLYYNKLVQTVTPYKHKKISLALVLRPMILFAQQQSTISSNPVLENTALVQVLSLYAVRRGLKDLVHEEIQKQMAPPVPVSFTLYGRTDLPKHFLVSAGLAVSAGSRLSNFIGIAKEVDDSGKGSGFSFADLAADKAGVRMGELAAGSLETALIFQQRMGGIEQETDFMPRIDGLPEGIRQLEFQKRYTDLDSNSYALVNGEIDKRINACPVFR